MFVKDIRELKDLKVKVKFFPLKYHFVLMAGYFIVADFSEFLSHRQFSFKLLDRCIFFSYLNDHYVSLLFQNFSLDKNAICNPKFYYLTMFYKNLVLKEFKLMFIYSCQ